MMSHGQVLSCTYLEGRADRFADELSVWCER